MSPYHLSRKLFSQLFISKTASGTQPGHTAVLTGQGMPQVRGSGHGDLTVHMEVVIPEKLDRKKRELVEKLRELGGEEPEVVTARTARKGGLFSRLRDAMAGH